MFDLLGGLLLLLFLPKVGKFLLKALFYACVVVPIQCIQLLVWLLELLLYGIRLLTWNDENPQGEEPQAPQLHLWMWKYWDD